MSRPIAIGLLATFLAGLVALWLLGVGARHVVRREAAMRGLEASWQKLAWSPPSRLSARSLQLTRRDGEPVFSAESLEVELDLASLLALRPRPNRIAISRAVIHSGRATETDPDTLSPGEALDGTDTARAVKGTARVRALTRMLLSPVRDLPGLSLRHIIWIVSEDSLTTFRGAVIESLDLARETDELRVSGRGTLRLKEDVPFAAEVGLASDQRFEGRFRFGVESARTEDPDALELAIRGHLIQKQKEEIVHLADSTVLGVRDLTLLLGGTLSAREPRLAFSVNAEGVSRDRIVQSLPAKMLGPLRELYVRGLFDYQLSLDLDLSHPEQVTLEARVIPRGLSLDRDRTQLPFEMDRPFLAVILLPNNRRSLRDLSPANPHFRPLDKLPPVLVHAVVTNEDGGFFTHRGFNLGAVKSSIAENLRAGRYRRGAGTITMQLARNLYTGHDRTLSRKAQEVVLAWVLENLTGLSKERLLEIYLNLIEWGPEVHGASEAAEFYFGREASDLSVAEALFLSTVIPAPRKWHYRFDREGRLRDFVRAQMHFIGRAMIKKGWLEQALLPAPDSLDVVLGGPARDFLSRTYSIQESAERTLDQAEDAVSDSSAFDPSHADSLSSSNPENLP